ncbi:TPA: hypothetical protein NKX81_002971 [Vibrio parahaemolyticus]|nr:hypothetical protein [Vibrio parahaemolyticus]HCH3608279.1 hypothetical protein [Vibrio parahaemolyticus]HCH4954253.1 hypothetical protein [Vibrio parahaemolyticus]HCH4970110.1 hypothetical protein [Vibrio parahaemolyticus]HCH5374168.1 hypothetical protein [Vibrio parahaemolyticus]
MKVFTMDDLSYRGAHKGVHSWDHPASTTPYYWHPDWLHVAEDATGSHPKEKLDVQAGDTPTQKHALKAILKHMNDWATDKLSSNPDIETNAVESEIELKK